MAYYAVEYVYNPSMTETMDEVRPTHRAFLSGLLEQGINVASGPLAGEVPGALILINAESQADVVSTQLLLEGASELSGVKDALSDFNEQGGTRTDAQDEEPLVRGRCHG